MNNNWLKPDWDTGTIISRIVIKDIIDKGIKALLIDVDGTLLPTKQMYVHENIHQWISLAKESFKVHLISNNPSYHRIKLIAKQLEINFTYKALKPRRISLLKAINDYKMDKKEVAIIGDRLFTDILAGNRAGIYTILVKKIDTNANSVKSDLTYSLEKKLVDLLGANL